VSVLPPPRARGFALIELLVALGVLGLVAAMLGSGIGLAGRLASGNSVARAATDAVANTQLILRERLMRLAPLPRLIAGNAAIEAAGAPAEFRWMAAAPGQRQPDSFEVFRLLLAPGGTLMLLSLSDLDNRVDIGAPSLLGWTPHPLLRDVEALDIAYFGPTRVDPRRQWQALWNDRPQPPELVRIRVRFAAGDPRTWPDLVVRPRTTVNTACRIDAQSGRCEGS
jgi:general secretion pathway protein J